ncbi:MAG: hypothetical protein QM756_39965 [Polyangiaceae bacterium]
MALLRFVGLALLCAPAGCEATGDLRPIERLQVSSGGQGNGGVAGSAAGGKATSGGCDGALADRDGDGYSADDGDCDDCDPLRNAGAFDVGGNHVDDDCDGLVDNEATLCDQALSVTGDAHSAANALGVCRSVGANASGRERRWGLLAARYVFPDGSSSSLPSDRAMDCAEALVGPNELSHGILSSFGPNVTARQGSAFVALSSGVARAGRQIEPLTDSDSPTGAFMCTRSLMPVGFPSLFHPSCGGGLSVSGVRSGDFTSAYDGIALELTLRAPTNARAVTFDSNFYSAEFPYSVCSLYSDNFAVFVRSASAPTERNVVLDSQGDPMGVDNEFIEVCEPYLYQGVGFGGPITRQFECSLGESELEGSGFDASANEGSHAASGWLHTRASVAAGQDVTIRFAILGLRRRMARFDRID